MAAFAALALFCAAAHAAPWPSYSKHATHMVRALPNGVQLQSYCAPSTFETFGTGVDHPLSSRAVTAHYQDAGLAFIGARVGGSDKFAFKSGYEGDVASHVYVSQHFNGLNVANAVANVALNKGGRVVSFDDAVSKAVSFLGGARNNVAPKLEYYALDTGALALTHVAQFELSNGHLVEAFIDATTGEVHGITDFTNDLTLRVIPINKQSPDDGFETLVDPEDPLSSPQGWTTLGGVDTGATSGNNAVGFKASQTTGMSLETSPDAFEYTFDPALEPSASPNVDVARVNSWYLVNAIHDITYRYGFTEAAFNFQDDNFGRGGAGGDRVTVSAQDAGATNNAQFTTPPDGHPGDMRLYLFTFTHPGRDGALQNDVVAHEATHGLTNRMTGGGTAGCLQANEARGLGEGWSDAFADWSEQDAAPVRDFVVAPYVLNSTTAGRTYPYSTDRAVNPLTYGDLQTRAEVHEIGEVWAEILHVVLAALVDALGFSENARTDPAQGGGNVVWLHLFVDALALQPCNPTMLAARAAWVQADADRYAGANACTLWSAFASRGLGVNAAGYVDNADVPAECA